MRICCPVIVAAALFFAVGCGDDSPVDANKSVQSKAYAEEAVDHAEKAAELANQAAEHAEEASKAAARAAEVSAEKAAEEAGEAAAEAEARRREVGAQTPAVRTEKTE